MRLEGAATECEERVKRDREARRWVTAAQHEVLKQAARHMDLSNTIFSICFFLISLSEEE